jgi:hypothetical protein
LNATGRKSGRVSRVVLPFKGPVSKEDISLLRI